MSRKTVLLAAVQSKMSLLSFSVTKARMHLGSFIAIVAPRAFAQRQRCATLAPPNHSLNRTARRRRLRAVRSAPVSLVR
jgi:hypothetical protein